MSWFYRTFVRRALFELDSEQIHDRTLRGLSWIAERPVFCELLSDWFAARPIPVKLCGLTFPNPVGLAAGMDKYAAALPIWEALGFGFCELGGVTWHPQPGNPKPRMFRVVEDGALINRMGFNNPGAEAMARRLAQWRTTGRWPRHPVGINLGKSKITPLENAAEDYANSFRLLLPYADFFVVNVSSPNTPNLRQLQDRAALEEILAALQSVSREKPLLVKVAPDLAFEAIDEILELALARNLAGIVATNTTITRPDGAHRIYAESGGLSGKPLKARSTEVIRHIHQRAPTLPIIGVGGIFSAADALEKMEAGASLVQVYTGMVYEGPSIARDIIGGLLNRASVPGA
jgi:dihydroorotate dehydrogenase